MFSRARHIFAALIPIHVHTYQSINKDTIFFHAKFVLLFSYHRIHTERISNAVHILCVTNYYKTSKTHTKHTILNDKNTSLLSFISSSEYVKCRYTMNLVVQWWYKQRLSRILIGLAETFLLCLTSVLLCCIFFSCRHRTFTWAVKTGRSLYNSIEWMRFNNFTST